MASLSAAPAPKSVTILFHISPQLDRRIQFAARRQYVSAKLAKELVAALAKGKAA